MELLRTKRLILRRFEESDFDSLASMMTDVETMKFTGFKTPQSIDKIQELLKKWHTEGNHQMGVWAVADHNLNEFIGWSMLKRTTGAIPELGYMIVKEHRGNGYATEIAFALIQHAQRTLKLQKVGAVTSLENFASIKVLERIGMTRAELVDGGVRFEIDFSD